MLGKDVKQRVDRPTRGLMDAYAPLWGGGGFTAIRALWCLKDLELKGWMQTRAAIWDLIQRQQYAGVGWQRARWGAGLARALERADSGGKSARVCVG